jgi:peptide/nickel transport system permease protein
LGLVGESGSGKSSVGNTLVGLAKPTAGQIVFDGDDITQVTPVHRRELASRIQIIFQDPYGSLNPARTIGSTLAEPLILAQKLSKTEAEDRVAATLAKVGLDASAAQRYPAYFSGGQRQRVAIARAMVLQPQLVVCDEPVSALDLAIQAQVLELLGDLQDDLGVAYLFVSHDLAVVRHFCDDIAVMYQGQIVEAGPCEDVCANPAHPYTKALLDSAPIPDPTAQRGRSKQVRRYHP